MPYSPTKKYERIYVELYCNFQVILLVCDDEEEVVAFVQKELAQQEDTTTEWLSNCEGATFYGDGGTKIITWLRELDTESVKNVVTCCHEMLHAATHILDTVGVYQGEHDGNKESLAYLQGFLVKRVLETGQRWEKIARKKRCG